MPLKHREIRQGLERKGFRLDEGRKHVHFLYEDLAGRLTTTRTMLSHGASGDDISDPLVGKMARQLGLSRKQFIELVDCSLSRNDFDALQAPSQSKPEQV